MPLVITPFCNLVFPWKGSHYHRFLRQNTTAVQPCLDMGGICCVCVQDMDAEPLKKVGLERGHIHGLLLLARQDLALETPMGEYVPMNPRIGRYLENAFFTPEMVANIMCELLDNCGGNLGMLEVLSKLVDQLKKTLMVHIDRGNAEAKFFLPSNLHLLPRLSPAGGPLEANNAQ